MFRLLRFYTETENFDVSIEPKQTEDPPKQVKKENIWVFFGKFRVVLVSFGFLRNSSVCFGCFDIGSKQRNEPKLFIFGFTKQTETNTKQMLFRFVSVRTEIYFCLFRGHPTSKAPIRASTAPGLLSIAPVLAFKGQADLHSSMMIPHGSGMRPRGFWINNVSSLKFLHIQYSNPGEALPSAQE